MILQVYNCIPLQVLVIRLKKHESIDFLSSTNHTLCSSRTTARCPLYSQVDGRNVSKVSCSREQQQTAHLEIEPGSFGSQADSLTTELPLAYFKQLAS